MNTPWRSSLRDSFPNAPPSSPMTPGTSLLSAVYKYISDSETQRQSISEWRSHIDQTLLHTRTTPNITQADFFKWKIDLKAEVLELMEAKIQAEVQKRVREQAQELAEWRQGVVSRLSALELHETKGSTPPGILNAVSSCSDTSLPVKGGGVKKRGSPSKRPLKKTRICT